MVKGIEHLAVISKDTDKIKDWYLKMFGGEVVYDNKKGTYFIAFPDKSMIEFIKSDIDNTENELKTGGIRHIALGVSKEEFDSAVEKLRAENVEVLTEVSESASGIKTFFFRDIDGNILHLIYRPDPLV
ncbi:MAG: VOC family protein [Oscillospiraceae bacterium]|nr:VOC family protein [Oscillospiraceae bacterium]